MKWITILHTNYTTKDIKITKEKVTRQNSLIRWRTTVPWSIACMIKNIENISFVALIVWGYV